MMDQRRRWQAPGRLLARAERLMQERTLEDTLFWMGRAMRAQKRAKEVEMHTHIALAIDALRQMEVEVERLPELIEAMAFLRTMDNTLRLQVERIVELQRQLTTAEEKRGEGDLR